jgi:uncharacterized protein
MDVNKWINERTIFMCIAGSHAYGLNNAESDTDYRGVCVPPIEYFMGLRKFEQKDNGWAGGDKDKVVYSVHKFAQLALKGSPNAVELLFMPFDCIVKTSTAWDSLLAARESFLSKRMYEAYRGFASSQDKQAKVAEDGTYKTKHASHCIRLLAQGIEVARTGSLNTRLTGEDLAVCRAIKQGLLSYDEFKAEASTRQLALTSAFDNSSLPATPDTEAVEELLCHLSVQANATRLRSYMCTVAYALPSAGQTQTPV